MDESTFDRLRKLIHREAGIALSTEKKPLLMNRLSKRLRALNIRSEEEYIRVLEADHTGDELVQLIDVVSTNVTYFFREPEHFRVYGEILQRWQSSGKRKFRIWCAAASTGEEPYTLAMLASETLAGGPDCKILATDISTRALRAAQQALYLPKQLEQVPSHYRSKYFQTVQTEKGEQCTLAPTVRSLVTYRRLNLSSFPYPLKGPIDIIFCRNVMIYFDRQLRQKIIDEFRRLLPSGGYLFLSHSENMLGIEHNLQTFATSVYVKP